MAGWHSHEWIVPVRWDFANLAASLQGCGTLVSDSSQSIDRLFLDTFDWRVYHAGGAIEAVSLSPSVPYRVTWRALAGGQERASLPVGAVPRFARDLPRSPLRELLEPVSGVRALLPLARVRTSARSYRLLNGDGKAVLRLLLERNALEAATDRPAVSLGSLLRVCPVKGYEKALERTLDCLPSSGLQPAATTLALRAYEAAGRRPAAYSAKFKVKLEPHMPADQAMRRILRRLLDTVAANEAGTRDDLDPEFLHDLRVAVRRTRSALSQIKRVLPAAVIERFRQEFAWLGQVTGPARDMHVYLLMLDEYGRNLPADVRADLTPLQDLLVRLQRESHQALVAALDSRRYRDLKASWEEFLSAEVPPNDDADNASRPIGSVANGRIWKMYRRVMKQGRAIGEESPAEELHELRKSCKKLRYLLEFFRSLYDKEALDRLVKALKGLQENLGEFQDLEVQIATLRRLGRQLIEEEYVAASTRAALERLTERLAVRQHAARAAFAERLAAFSDRRVHRSFKTLFRDQRTPRPAPA